MGGGRMQLEQILIEQIKSVRKIKKNNVFINHIIHYENTTTRYICSKDLKEQKEALIKENIYLFKL